MENSNLYQQKWLTILIPLYREIHKIVGLKVSHKEKLFQIQLALFGSAEELKEVSNEWIDVNIFSSRKLESKNVEKVQLTQFKMEFQLHMN
ncbi:MAG TPA: hypothetical protein VL021_04185 [Brumimicrobium sp.]|nr:hypothetical protein [Brumimicrobium sp.]